MSEHFLTKTKLETGQPVRIQQTAVVERYEELRATLAARAGEDVARLFAEPFINWGNDVSGITVSWYCDVAGNAKRLSSLDPTLRDEAEQRLTTALEKTRDLIGEPDVGKLVAGALSVSSPDDILVVGNQPVIVNWGMLPPGATDSQGAQNAHFAGTLGKYLPLAAAPVLFATDASAAPPAAVGGEVAGVSAAQAASAEAEPTEARSPGDIAADAAASGGGQQGGSDERRIAPEARPRIWPVAVLAAVLALFALWLLLPGTRLFPSDRTDAARALDERSLELVRQLNQDLEERAEVLEAALEGAVCTPDGSLVLPDGRLPDGILPPPSDASISPSETGRGDVIREGRSDAIVPPDPSRISVPDAPRPEGGTSEEDTATGPDGEGGTEPESPNLVAVIEERTVLIVAQSDSGLGVGTGFFIGPDLVATNHHVIESAISGGTVFVSNNDLEGLRPAQIVDSDGPFEDTLADFAILRVPDVRAPFFRLGTVPGSLKLQNVIAAGYPTDIMESDFRFQQLLDGVSTAVPDLIFTDGVVNTEQAVSETRALLVHSAPISKGNSGGPLIDTCGRVVGMNTFVREETFRNLNIAQSNQNLLEFLSGAGVTPETSSDACVPQIARSSVPRELPSDADTPDATADPETDPGSESAPGTLDIEGATPEPLE